MLINNLIYFFLLIKSKFMYTQRYLTSYLFGFKELKLHPSNNMFIIPRLILFNLLSRLRSYIDIKVDKLHITKVTENGDQSIILDKKDITFQDVNDNLNIDIDKRMNSHVFLTFCLVDQDDTKTCLKDLIIKYKDLDQKYNNTLKNILLFNGINYRDDSKVNLRFYKNNKFVSRDLLFRDICDEHITQIMNLEK